MAKPSKKSREYGFQQMKKASDNRRSKSVPSEKKTSDSDKKCKPRQKNKRPKKSDKPAQTAQKQQANALHPRNLHRKGYNFAKLIDAFPPLEPYKIKNPVGKVSIDFTNPKAVKALNAALLHCYYQIEQWDIPQGYLCPPIPGRVDYIHYLADLFYDFKESSPKGKNEPVRGLDIGTGANGIYPILGIQCYGWDFVASDIDKKSLENVQKIIDNNSENLSDKLELRHQTDSNKIFAGIIKKGEKFDFTMCNPPFHSSLEEAQSGSKKKVAKLTENRAKRGLVKENEKTEFKLNFGGQKAELWCPGGERKFLYNMIRESADYKDQVRWFTTLVSKGGNLKPCYHALEKAGAKEIKTIEMAQGNKITRILAWRFQ